MGKAGAVAVAAPQADAPSASPRSEGETVTSFFLSKINELELLIKDKSHNLRRLEAQRNELNTQGERERCRRRGRRFDRHSRRSPFRRFAAPLRAPKAKSDPSLTHTPLFRLARTNEQCACCARSSSCSRSRDPTSARSSRRVLLCFFVRFSLRSRPPPLASRPLTSLFPPPLSDPKTKTCKKHNRSWASPRSSSRCTRRASTWSTWTSRSRSRG